MARFISTPRISSTARLMGATAIGLIATMTFGQSTQCELVNGVLPAGCEQGNAGLAVTMPVGEQASEVFALPANAAGFTVRINDRQVVEDAAVENIARRVDVVLAEADVLVVFDGLGAAPRLDLEVVGEPTSHAAGDQVTLQSALNYPAYIVRAEIRIVDLGGTVGARTIGVAPINPNGQTSVTVPEGDDIYVVHRVYDANGRYDETHPVPLTQADTRPRVDGVEDGANTMARSRIPVYGGAITVSGRDLVPGATVRALGETVQPDPSGGFVIQRIVPAGDYDVDVAVNGAGQRPLNETRRVDVPRSEWFYAGIADLTYGTQLDPDTDSWDTYDRGRFAIYVDGRTDNGLQITGSLDTGEGPLDEIFRDLDEKDPASVLNRLDPNDLYPTYGDDSTIVDNTPTDGKVYLRLEQQGNFALWGNFDSQLGGSEYVRNERALYGLQGHYAAQDTRTNGEAIASVDLYAAQPDQLPQREAFLGTGGSVYFLERQDIGVGTETVAVQLRDPISGRVIGATTLTAGVDYDINYIQGIVTLAQPLQSGIVDGGLITDITGDADLQLVVQYEYTPTSTDVDGFSYGGRTEVWVSNGVRIGASGLVEDNGIDEQTLVGADLRLQANDNTFVQLDYAESDGPGFGSTFSADGGLIVETQNPFAGSGTAVQVEGQADFADLGWGGTGQIKGYAEARDEGFSNLDFTVDTATGDEELWGLAIAGQATERLSYGVSLDSYENAVGDLERRAGAQIGYEVTERLTAEIGVELLDRIDVDDPTETGTRTDLGGRLTYAVTDQADVYIYGQKSFDISDIESNDRVGVGASYAWDNGWGLTADISDGDQGQAARLLANYDDGAGNTHYAGYELEAGRDLAGVTQDGTDRGRFVVGAQRAVSDNVRAFGENTYDAFGRHRTLTSAYGLAYNRTDATQYSAAFEMGRIDDGADYDFERYALSLGASYETEIMALSGRFEYRADDGILDGTEVASDTYLLASDLTYKFSNQARIVAGLDYARTDTDQGSLLDGEYGEVVLGYAFRPILDDKFNMLARYRYLHDMFGQRVDGDDENGPRQRSHVVSVNGIYDINEHWSLGGKVGYRSSETAADDASDFVQNDAYLLAGSVTYHLVHEWDVMVEARNFTTVQGGTSETSLLAAGHRHFGNNVKLGVGYNFGSFSDDLTDLVQDDQGAFLNLVAKF
ncbi:hypothetical protein DS901_12250 [Loktanella sp. D2R18]|uniref:hypothetical protein n=1 Tax=Rhodobacterales TaxID=204455 RepID=UPI000DE8A109|nr:MULTISPECIES: hypothetical protein [Rhodobacterales]MDO6590182.1 hypothetical protein [Yoonia sp. 1_MG-2023]RBW42990.1 hypothetical protein DS901_12250 [Loktanella sp. D2R18]